MYMYVLICLYVHEPLYDTICTPSLCLVLSFRKLRLRWIPAHEKYCVKLLIKRRIIINVPFHAGRLRQRSGNGTKETLSLLGFRKRKIKNCSGGHWLALRLHVPFHVVQPQQKRSPQLSRPAPWNLNFMPVSMSWFEVEVSQLRSCFLDTDCERKIHLEGDFSGGKYKGVREEPSCLSN